MEKIILEEISVVKKYLYVKSVLLLLFWFGLVAPVQ